MGSVGEFVAAQADDPYLADIIDGYLDGREDERTDYPEATNRSAFYRHGWLNGRDDRVGTPRASAATIREDLRRLYDEVA